MSYKKMGLTNATVYHKNTKVDDNTEKFSEVILVQ